MRKFKNKKLITICNNCSKILKDNIPIQRYSEKGKLQHFCSVDCLTEFLKIEENIKKKKDEQQIS